MKVPEKNFIPIFVPSTHATFENNLDEITDHPSTSKLVRTSSPYSFITMKHIDEAKIKNIEMAVVSTVDVVEARPTDVVEVKPNDVVKVKPTGMTEVKPTDVVEVKSIDMVEVKSTDVVEVKPIDTAYVEVDKVNCIDVQNENELIEDESETGKEKLPSDSQFENVDQSEFTESVMVGNIHS